MEFKLHSKFQPTGDQPEAIKELTEGVFDGIRTQVLVGVTGSGKTTVLIHRIANLMKYGRGSDCAEVPDWATPDDLAFLADYVKSSDPPKTAAQERQRRVAPAAP